VLQISPLSAERRGAIFVTEEEKLTKHHGLQLLVPPRLRLSNHRRSDESPERPGG
jgi:hypothetical protein